MTTNKVNYVSERTLELFSENNARFEACLTWRRKCFKSTARCFFWHIYLLYYFDIFTKFKGRIYP